MSIEDIKVLLSKIRLGDEVLVYYPINFNYDFGQVYIGTETYRRPGKHIGVMKMYNSYEFTFNSGLKCKLAPPRAGLGARYKDILIYILEGELND